MRPEILATVAVVMMTGCTSTEAPTVQHTYVTNTQDYHELAGLKIRCVAGPMASLNFAIGAAVRTPEYQEFFVDGRSVLKTNGLNSAETFLQLPPGEHELVVVDRLKGELTFGAAVDARQKKYRIHFTLGRGKTATLSTQDWVVKRLDGAEGYDVLEGEQLLGKTIVSEPASTGSEARPVEDTLRKLKVLHEQGLISDEVYKKSVSKAIERPN